MMSPTKDILDSEKYNDCPFCKVPVLKINIIDHMEECRLFNKIDSMKQVYDDEMKWEYQAS